MENETQAPQAVEGGTPAVETPATPAAKSTWSYDDNASGAGDRPEWFKEKYKTVAEQAKAYNELESKLGGFTSAPVDGYSLNEGIEADAENVLFKNLGEIGAKYNMNNDMYNEIVGMYNEHSKVEAQQFREAQISELGDNAQSRIKNLQDWAGANIPEGLRDNFLNWSQSAKDIEAMEALIGLTKGQKLATEAVPVKAEFTEEGLKELQFAENERGQRLVSVDPAHLAKYRSYSENLHKLQSS